MKAKSNDIFLQDKVFVWIAVITGLILMIPLVAMQFSDEVDWNLADFIIIGTLLFGMGSLFALIARNTKDSSKRLTIAVIIAITTLYIYAELAVGIFTNIGS